MILVCNSLGIYPNHGCGVKITPDINPIYLVMRRYCLRDSKNVSFVYVGLVKAGLDLMGADILNWVLILVGGHSNNLVRT